MQKYGGKMRIGLVGDNSKEYINKLLEIWNGNNCAVLIDWRMPEEKIFQLLEYSNVKKCIVDKKIYDKWENKESELFEIYNSESQKKVVIDKETKAKFKVNYSNDEAVILFSSGTTGNAKGIILTFAAINKNADMIIDTMKPKKDDTIYIFKILVHSSTLISEFLVGLKSDMQMIVSSVNISIRNLVKELIANKVTIMGINPTILYLIVEYLKGKDITIDSMKKMYVCGAMLNPNVQMEMSKYIPNGKVLNLYGLTEAGPMIASQSEDACNRGSVGKTLLNVNVKIDRDKGEKYGKVMVKTSSIASGYINKELNIVDGWLDTKDLGFIDEDNELHIIGRSDDLIIKNACNVYPYTIEKCILENSSVDECVAFGINDTLHGEKIVCIYSGECEEKELRNICKKKLLSHETPDIFKYREKLERNKNGKVDVIANKNWFIKGEKSNES